MTTTMRAFVLEKYNGPGAARLCSMPKPQPGPRELLIQVHAAGLNPVDYKFRQGKLKLIYRPKLPAIMGNELAGTIVARGAEVAQFAEGDRVFVRCDTGQMGAFAEFVCVPQHLAAKMPGGLDFDHAAGVPLAGLTALQALRDELQVKAGNHLFISGGAGGVGTFAIQIAKWLGAEVTTTISPQGESLVRSLGADHTIDYTQGAFDRELRNLDGALDLVGGETLSRLFRVVKPGGKVVSIAGIPEPTTARQDLQLGWGLTFLFWLASARLRGTARRYGVQYRYYFMHASGSDLEELARLIDAGKLKVIVDRCFPFSQIQDAFVYLEQGHAKGKVIVHMEHA